MQKQCAVIWVLLVNIITAGCHTYDHLQPINTLCSWKQAFEIFEQYAAGTLILLDVDYTLIVQDQGDAFVLGRYAWPQWLRERMIAEYQTLAEPAVWEHFYSIVWKHAPRYLTEPEVVDVINKAHEYGHNVIALTMIESGHYGVIDSSPVWRHEMLMDMGITFSTIIPDIILNQLPQHRNRYPVVYKGIICCNECNKGAVLHELLRVIDYRPQHIVFIDDVESNLCSVGEMCAILEIPYTLYHYNNPKFAKPEVNLEDFMHKVAYVLTMGQYPYAGK